VWYSDDVMVKTRFSFLPQGSFLKILYVRYGFGEVSINKAKNTCIELSAKQAGFIFVAVLISSVHGEWGKR